MAKSTTLYEAFLIITEEELLFLIKTADSLDEIGATEQALAIRNVTQFFSRRREIKH